MPQELYIKGTLPKGRPLVVAIVGSRRPTAYGKHVTHQLSYELAKRGVVIVSGLAYGIDAIAHEAALEAGGVTIAVMANGLHRIYPVAHTELAKRIVAQGGALISEQPPGVDARSYHFLARNRIVSGLADALIVTEASDRSGTYSTVTHAITQNKEVFAVPGPITSLLSVGPNKVLQQGARVCLSAQDVLDVIAPHLKPTQTLLPLGDTPLEVSIIKLLSNAPAETDALIETLTEPPSEVLQALTMLELNGTIKVEAGKYFLR